MRSGRAPRGSSPPPPPRAGAAMGRKSSKAKEKKQKRLEERAAMDAVCAKVEAANKLEDPLEAFPVFKRYERNGLNVAIECKRGSGLEPATLDWAFELTKANMQSLYEQSEWGWKEREKREELRDERAWYLIARDSALGPVAFSHFRFDVECGDEVLYCYEVQLESRVRRRGLGKFLLQILQLVANSTQMKKVMLTVFKHNHGAYQFFREALHALDAGRAPRAAERGSRWTPPPRASRGAAGTPLPTRSSAAARASGRAPTPRGADTAGAAAAEPQNRALSTQNLAWTTRGSRPPRPPNG
ncbi:N-alpha-acetyltransferase 40 isoform X1 [Phaenicophaeus curvirostris]|uniref:N-alpha-acetyltransferase 40 isoform X1 n=1 Tax=Phaenicophaeus curvirostris TaxID=33595 RepID=UPI0037F0FE88